MTLLERNEYHRLRGLLSPVAHLLVVREILEGRAPARCWSDGADVPSMAVVWDLVNAFVFCAADASSSTEVERLDTLLHGDVVPAAAKRGYASLYVLCTTETLLQRMGSALSTHGATPRGLDFHARTAGDPAPRQGVSAPLDSDFELRRITTEMLGSKLENVGEVGRCIDACWTCRERFLEHGIGYALVREGEVASWCGTDYVVDGAAELYVETFGDHQGKGLATRVASACIAACLDSRWTVHWHCWTDNRGSVRVAEKCGLTLKSATPALRIRPA